MTTREAEERRIELQRRPLGSHVAEQLEVSCGDTAGTRIILGRKTDDGQWRAAYYLDYLILGNRLIVVGDCGSAVYEWSEKIDLAFLAGCALDYFASKCSASQTGSGGRSWDFHYAEAALVEAFTERRAAGEPEPSPAAVADALRAAGSAAEWSRWLGDEGYDVFGEDYCDYARIGEVEAPTTIIHWLGLQLAHEQLGSDNRKSEIANRK